MYPDCIRNLIDELRKLPGIGNRTAERLALFISRRGKGFAFELAGRIQDVGEKIRSCSICFNTSESDPCPICTSTDREREKLLIVERSGDLNAFEESGWKGLYHVLQGTLDPVEGILPEHLTIDPLLKRIDEEDFTEVIIATNPDFEGDGTAMVLTKRLQNTKIRVTRIARGMATGAKIEYASRAMLEDSLQGRTVIHSKG